MTKLTPADRMAIRAMRAKGARYAKIAAAFGCSVPHVSNIITGRIGANDKAEPEKPSRQPNVMPGIRLSQLTARR